MSDKKEPRGYRNKNPGNLKLTNINWDGKIPNTKNTDKVFEQFTTDFYGIRAAAMDLDSDINKGANTITKLINEYAPTTENKTQNYINFVVKQTGIGANAALKRDTQTILALLKAIFHYENGFLKYGDFLIINAIEAGAGKRDGFNK